MLAAIIGIIGSILPAVLKLFGIGSTPDPAVAERKAGEDLGKAKADAKDATQALHEVEGAVAAGDAERAAVASDPGRLQRDGASVRPFDPSATE